ncbi:MAG: hypothetical protein FWD59_09930 [Micrococcales bacterium]|nr:hypothetical protein [Micrococcales bacterium]
MGDSDAIRSEASGGDARAGEPQYGRRVEGPGGGRAGKDQARITLAPSGRRRGVSGVQGGKAVDLGDRPSNVTSEPGDKPDRPKKLAMRPELFAKLTDSQRREFAAVTRTIFTVGLLVIGAFFALSGSLPWPAVGLGMAVFAVVSAIRGIRRARRLPFTSGAVTSLTAAVVLASLLALWGGMGVPQWPARWHYQQCTAKALTVQATNACWDEYTQESRSILNRLISR